MTANNITFDAATHTYRLGKKKLISVTQLLKKHGLSPDYSGVREEVLNAKAERGTLIHKEIEDYINSGAGGFSSELDDFIKITETLRLADMKSETTVHNDICAGTIDITGVGVTNNETRTILADIKTSATLHKESVRWQLSVYEYLSGAAADDLYAFHLGKDSKAVKLDRIPREEVEKLFDCERRGVIYSQKALAVSGELLAKVQAAECAVSEVEKEYKAATAARDILRAEIMKAMTEQGVKTFETAALRITYIDPVTKETVDVKTLKKDLPEIAAKYLTETVTKASVRVTVK